MKLKLTKTLLVIWILFFTTLNFLWFKIDHRSSRWDESAQLYMSEYSFQKLQEGDVYGAIKIDRISSTKAGGVPLFSAIEYFIFGDSTKLTILLMISISLLIITVSTYFIGEILFSSLIGLSASILFVCYQGVFLWYKYYLPDLPLTAATTLTVLLIILIFKDNFKSHKLPLYLGLTIAVGMCIKHLYVIYVFLPLLFLISVSLFQKKEKLLTIIKKKRYFYIFLLSGILIGTAYNIINFSIIKEQLFRNFQHDSSGISWYIRQNPKEYINTVIDFVSFDTKTRMIFPAIFILGLVCSLIRFSKARAFIYLWILSSFVFLLFFIYSTMPYYFIPVLPAISLLSFGWLDIKSKKFPNLFSLTKYLALLLFLYFLINNFLIKNIGTNNLLTIISRSPQVIFNKERLKTNPFVDKPYWINAYVDGNVATLPYPHYWYVGEMIDEINNFTLNNNTKTNYYIGSMNSEYEWTTAEYVTYKIWQKKLNNKLYLLRAYAPEKNISVKDFLDKYDFLITKTGKVAKNDFYGGWGDSTWAFDTQIYVENLLKDNGKILKDNNFVLIKNYNLPDGSIGQVWGKIIKS